MSGVCCGGFDATKAEKGDAVWISAAEREETKAQTRSQKGPGEEDQLMILLCQLIAR